MSSCNLQVMSGGSTIFVNAQSHTQFERTGHTILITVTAPSGGVTISREIFTPGTTSSSAIGAITFITTSGSDGSATSKSNQSDQSGTTSDGIGNKTNFIQGTPGNDVLNGTPGNDVMSSGQGNAQLCSAEGNDRLLGGASQDILVDNVSTDTLTGGPDADLFVLQAATKVPHQATVIPDFSVTDGDRLALLVNQIIPTNLVFLAYDSTSDEKADATLIHYQGEYVGIVLGSLNAQGASTLTSENSISILPVGTPPLPAGSPAPPLQ